MRQSLATIALVLGLSAPALAGTGHDRAVVAGAGTADAAAALRLAQLAEPQPTATGDARVAIDFGTYFALVIGNQEYKNLADVPSARDDADGIAEVLTERFGFQVELLLDASRYEIISALAALRRELEETDNLLIYYAGHGHLDIESEEGYWLPVDAEPDNSVNWVSNSTMTGLIRAVRAKHVIVIADSTYSGRLTRNVDADLMTGTEQDAWIARMVLHRSRTAMTSGSAKPVPHPIGGPNSVFARALLETFREMTRPSDGQTVFDAIKRPVVLNADRTPQYANLNKAGHDGGDFVFVPLLASLAPGDVTEAVVLLPPPALAPVPEAPLADAETIELVFWQSVANSSSAADYQAYLDQYPDGIFAPLAQGRINELGGAAAPTTPAPDTGPGIIEQAFWDAVADSGNSLDLEAYLQQYPNGHFAETSRAMLEEIARAEAVEAEGERLAAEEAENQRLAAEEAERIRLQAEADARQRLAAEEAERQRRAAEEAERQRLAAQEAERQRLAAETEAERQRLAAEEAERQGLAAQEAERQRLAAEEAERQRVVAEEAERKRWMAEAERQRLAAQEAARKRIAAQEAELQRLAAEAAEQQRLAAATEAERQRLAAEEAERQRLAALEAERQRLAIVETERERRAAEAEAERQRLVVQEAERKRLAAEEAERRRKAAEEAEHLRLAAHESERQMRLAEEEAERQRLAAEAAKRQRLLAAEAERQRLAAEVAERQRLAALEAERKRLAAEEAERQRLAAEAAEHQRQLAAEAERKRRAAEQTAKENAEAQAKEMKTAALAPSAAVTPKQTFMANTGKKIPPIAAPMYLTAYASVVTGRSANAIKPLRHLVEADPALADVHNAFALALFTADPNDDALALEHADIALALAPDVPQFAVTRVLTDRKQWKIAADGTARLTAAAARSLKKAANVLVTMRSNARKLGKLLSAIEQSGGDAEYPFVLPGYTTLIKNPKLDFTRPSDKAFRTAQKAIEQKIIALRQRMIAGEEGVAN